MIKFDVIFAIFLIGLQFYALIDCARTSQESVRGLPKWAWILLIVIFGVFASIAWIFMGRPKQNPGRRSRHKIVPPDDDPEFLRGL
jgi:hypothetical protein